MHPFGCFLGFNKVGKSSEFSVIPNKRNDSCLHFFVEISVLPNRRIHSHSPD